MSESTRAAAARLGRLLVEAEAPDLLCRAAARLLLRQGGGADLLRAGFTHPLLEAFRQGLATVGPGRLDALRTRLGRELKAAWVELQVGLGAAARLSREHLEALCALSPALLRRVGEALSALAAPLRGREALERLVVQVAGEAPEEEAPDRSVRPEPGARRPGAAVFLIRGFARRLLALACELGLSGGLRLVPGGCPGRAGCGGCALGEGFWGAVRPLLPVAQDVQSLVSRVFCCPAPVGQRGGVG